MTQILMLDSTGTPIRWAGLHKVASYYANGKVIVELGEHRFQLSGGVPDRRVGARSKLIASSIVMIRGRHRLMPGHERVTLNKWTLFARDRRVCAYCAGQHAEDHLTMEHVIPLSRGGRHHWMNLVTACRACNHRKGSRTPEEVGMPLAYVPYVPNRYEGFILKNRSILADQMAFLLASVPKHSRLHA
jgi:5-methylcytosine-specific restriction endonuclease McrA